MTSLFGLLFALNTVVLAASNTLFSFGGKWYVKHKNKIMSHFQCLHVEAGYRGRKRVPDLGIPPGASKSFDKGLFK